MMKQGKTLIQLLQFSKNSTILKSGIQSITQWQLHKINITVLPLNFSRLSIIGFGILAIFMEMYRDIPNRDLNRKKEFYNEFLKNISENEL